MDQAQQEKLLTYLLDLLAKTPDSADDAFRLYNNIIDKIAHHLITKLSDDEEKHTMMAKLIEKIMNKKINIE